MSHYNRLNALQHCVRVSGNNFKRKSPLIKSSHRARRLFQYSQGTPRDANLLRERLSVKWLLNTTLKVQWDGSAHCCSEMTYKSQSSVYEKTTERKVDTGRRNETVCSHTTVRLGGKWCHPLRFYSVGTAVTSLVSGFFHFTPHAWAPPLLPPTTPQSCPHIPPSTPIPRESYVWRAFWLPNSAPHPGNMIHFRAATNGLIDYL